MASNISLEAILAFFVSTLTCSLFCVPLSLTRQANVADYSDNQWVTCFQESAEAILGQNSAYLGQLKDSVSVFFQLLTVQACSALSGSTVHFKGCGEKTHHDA